MDTRRLELLVELARLGSMRAVADELGVTTSTVSQQVAALAREVGTPLVEPDGRRIRLTPAGTRLARHGVTILAAVQAAHRDLDPAAEPAGTVRVAGFATAIRRSLLPLLADLAGTHPDLRLVFAEHEPAEALELIARDAVDLALVYDYELAPRAFGDRVEVTTLWSARWGLAVPDTGAAPDDARTPGRTGSGEARAPGPTVSGEPRGTAVEVVGRHRQREWIVNSRNTADEQVLAVLAALAGFTPTVSHRADSLELTQDLIAAGLGVGLLPEDQPPRPGVRLLPLRGPDVRLRAYAVVGRGRAGWAPLSFLLDRLTGGT